MPVTLDPDAAAVYQAFQDAGRPPYETLTPPEARAYYLAARPVTNPEPPELERVAPAELLAPRDLELAGVEVRSITRLDDEQTGMAEARRALLDLFHLGCPARRGGLLRIDQ